MGRAAAVLDRRRAAAFVALAVVVGIYYGTHESWFRLSLWGSIAWLCFIVIPAVFGFVWLALPAWALPLRQLLVATAAFAAAAVVLQATGASPVALSFTFPVPGIDNGAKLGLPDLLFFALYLAAADRWRLRVGWTWLCLVASIGGTISLATALDVDGLPALPLLSLGFLLPNADLLWRAVRGRSARDPRRSPT